MLKERDLTVGQISDAFEIPRRASLIILICSNTLDLYRPAKMASFVTYSLETTVLDDSLGWILDLIRKGKAKRKQKCKNN